MLYAANRFDEADRVFEQVVINKKDYANGWYNWAYSAKQMNKLADAVQRLNQAVALVPADSGDFEKANQELAAWKKEYDEGVAKAQAAAGITPTPTPKSSTLKAPEPIPTMGEEEKVDVPAEGMEPPKVTTTPSPTITPTVNPTTTPGNNP